MLLPSYFQLSLSNPDETGLVLVSLIDSRTGFIVRTALPNSGVQTASIMAFAGARYSRSSITANELFKEIKDADRTANERLSTIFRNYGHASVADMAQLFAYIENIPQLYACKFYNETSIGGGQERSTRYQDFSDSVVEGLDRQINETTLLQVHESTEYIEVNEDYKELQSIALNNYRKHVDLLTEKLAEVYEVDTTDKKQKSALTARVFDCARYFLPNGTCNRTSICWITSAREWARIISQFKSQKDFNLQYLAEQLEFLFAPDQEVAKNHGYQPEAADLIRYTKADETTSNNIKYLKEFLVEAGFESEAEFDQDQMFKPVSVKLLDASISAGTKIVAQNILSIYPTLDENWLLQWITELDNKQKKELSEKLLQNYDHHRQMGNQFRVNTHSFVVYCSIGEGRDLNRHRAWGRFMPMLASEQNYYNHLDSGYTLPMYLSENSVLDTQRQIFEEDLQNYYKKLRLFTDKTKEIAWFPHHLILQLLPFASIMKIWFHGSPKEISYLTKLRVRPGGHINYRAIAYFMSREAAKSDNLLQGLSIDESKQPDPTSRTEFLDRS